VRLQVDVRRDRGVFRTVLATRQQQRHAGPDIELAFSDDMAEGLLDATIDHGKSETGALTNILGGEEELEDLFLDARRHADAAVGNGDGDEVPAVVLAEFADILVGVGDFDDEAPAGIASRALLARLTIACSSSPSSAAQGQIPGRTSTSRAMSSPSARRSRSSSPSNSDSTSTA